jgi:hypothetical protein
MVEAWGSKRAWTDLMYNFAGCSPQTTLLDCLCSLLVSLFNSHTMVIGRLSSWGFHYSFSFTLIPSYIVLSDHQDTKTTPVPVLTGLPLKSGWKSLCLCNSYILHANQTSTMWLIPWYNPGSSSS